MSNFFQKPFGKKVNGDVPSTKLVSSSLAIYGTHTYHRRFKAALGLTSGHYVTYLAALPRNVQKSLMRQAELAAYPLQQFKTALELALNLTGNTVDLNAAYAGESFRDEDDGEDDEGFSFDEDDGEDGEGFSFDEDGGEDDEEDEDAGEDDELEEVPSGRFMSFIHNIKFNVVILTICLLAMLAGIYYVLSTTGMNSQQVFAPVMEGLNSSDQELVYANKDSEGNLIVCTATFTEDAKVYSHASMEDSYSVSEFSEVVSVTLVTLPESFYLIQDESGMLYALKNALVIKESSCDGYPLEDYPGFERSLLEYTPNVTEGVSALSGVFITFTLIVSLLFWKAKLEEVMMRKEYVRLVGVLVFYGIYFTLSPSLTTTVQKILFIFLGYAFSFNDAHIGLLNHFREVLTTQVSPEHLSSQVQKELRIKGSSFEVSNFDIFHFFLLFTLLLFPSISPLRGLASSTMIAIVIIVMTIVIAFWNAASKKDAVFDADEIAVVLALIFGLGVNFLLMVFREAILSWALKSVEMSVQIENLVNSSFAAGFIGLLMFISTLAPYLIIRRDKNSATSDRKADALAQSALFALCISVIFNL